MNKKLLLFDCDETLWTSGDGDYISSVISLFQKKDGETIERLADHKTFRLRPNVKQAFAALHKQSACVSIGIVSDNDSAVVQHALQLFDLWQYIDDGAYNVRLWQGYCPKQRMVLEILQRPTYSDIEPSNVYLFDDKDYGSALHEIGAHFELVSPNTDIYVLVSTIFKGSG